MKRSISVLALLFCLFVPQRVHAQATGTVTGIVTGTGGAPLAGAAVNVVGTTRSAQTGADGRFTLTAVPAGNRTVRATFAGHSEATRAVSVAAGQTATANISLTPQVVELEGVVAVGYGTARRRDVTGSVSSVAMDEIPVANTASAGQMVQGRVAGAQVTVNNGAPGAGVTIRVRGTASIAAASEPLYVIDGVPAEPSGIGNSPYTNPLNAINPNDIASIEVLKDASSTAIYGSRGAAGVVLITTKQGQRGADRLSVESMYGMQSPANRMDMLNAPQFAELVNEARANTGLGPAYSATEMAAIQAAGPGTDWQSLMLRDAPMQSHSVSFSGGDAQTRYLLSGSYYNQEGIILNSDFVRYSGRVNLERILNDRLQVGTNLTVSNVDARQQPTDGGVGNGAITSALWFNPVVGPKDANGNWILNSPVTWPATNPLAIATDNLNQSNTFSVIGSGNVTYRFLDGLQLRSSFGLTTNVGRNTDYAPRTSPSGAGSNGQGSITTSQSTNLSNENILSFQRELGPGNLDLTTGFTVQTSRSRGTSSGNSQFVNDVLGPDNLGSGTRPTTGSSYSNWALLSWLGRANYNLMDRYLFTVTGRRDGSSRFGENSKWGFFPSGAFAWRVVDEPFLQDQSLFSDLKLRLSYGVTGNQEIGLYQSLARLASTAYTFGGQAAVGFAPAGAAPNPDLKWETTKQYNVGLDFGILDNRVSGSVDAYHSVTDDLLLSVTLPATSGFTSALRNVGSVKNDGIEVALTTVNVDMDRFAWRSTLTLAHNRNEVLDLGVQEEIRQGTTAIIVGMPLGTFVGKKTDGIFQQGDTCTLTSRRPHLDCVPGELNWVDGNGDGKIDGSDNIVVGIGQPDLYGGLTNTMTAGPFELQGFLSFSYGGEVLNQAAVNMKNVNTFSNQTADALRRWTPTNTNTNVPRANADRPRETFDTHVEDGSFLRLQTMSLGYNIPAGLIPSTSNARVYVTGQNLALWTNYTGFDPEVNSRGNDATAPGVDGGAYPKSRTYSVGVNLVF